MIHVLLPPLQNVVIYMIIVVRPCSDRDPSLSAPRMDHKMCLQCSINMWTWWVPPAPICGTLVRRIEAGVDAAVNYAWIKGRNDDGCYWTREKIGRKQCALTVMKVEKTDWSGDMILFQRKLTVSCCCCYWQSSGCGCNMVKEVGRYDSSMEWGIRFRSPGL